MRRQLVGVFFALLVGVSCTAWAAPYPMTVTSIGIEGTVKIKDKDILEAIDFEVGDEIAQADLRAASQAIFDLGWFSEVVPDVGESGEITFRVVEYPVVREIVITGNTHRKWYSLLGVRLFSLPIVPTSKIQQILYQADVRKRKVLNRVALETGLKDVIAEYNDRGYVLVALGDVKLEETIRVEIVEGHVAANMVTGLRTVPTGIAEDMIDLKLGEPLERVDVQRVIARFRGSVYFTGVEVVPQPGEQPDGVVLQWKLVERELLSEPVRVEAIALDGITCYEEEAVLAKLGEIPTEPIDNYGLLRILEGVYDLYSDAGYMMVRFVVEAIDEGRLRIRIDEGRVEEIAVAGLKNTREYVVLRKLDIEVGQVLTRADYLVTYQNLTSLGYFASVDLTPEWIDGGVRMTVTVSETSRLGGFEGTMALDPKTGGVVGELKVREKNLFGTGQDVALTYSRGLVTQDDPTAATWDLSYTSVAFFPEFDRVGLDLYRSTTETDQTEDSSTLLTYGLKTSFAYPVADYVDLGITYKHEEERTLGETRWIPTDSVTLAITYNDITDIYFPTDGTRRTISFEKAGGFSAGREYVNVALSWAQFSAIDLPLFGNMREAIGTRFKVGWGDDRLPASQHYELGGPMSVRGMESLSVARIVVANLEYRVELAEQGLYMTTFLDTGVDLDAVRSDAVLSSAGIEFTVNAVGVLVRLDIAWRLSSEWSWVPRFEIGFGQMF